MAVIASGRDKWMAGVEAGGPVGIELVQVRPAYEYVKRAVDIIVCVVLLVGLLPLLVAIGIAVVLDRSGPVLFQQLRIGRYGRPFSMLKFRTMAPERRAIECGP